MRIGSGFWPFVSQPTFSYRSSMSALSQAASVSSPV
jgi:hypothetical protein